MESSLDMRQFKAGEAWVCGNRLAR